MTYEEALDATVTRDEAKREIEKHSASWDDFVAEHGDHETYEGETVLGWLGY
jgi:hypothetical protein